MESAQHREEVTTPMQTDTTDDTVDMFETFMQQIPHAIGVQICGQSRVGMGTHNGEYPAGREFAEDATHFVDFVGSIEHCKVPPSCVLDDVCLTLMCEGEEGDLSDVMIVVVARPAQYGPVTLDEFLHAFDHPILKSKEPTQ